MNTDAEREIHMERVKPHRLFSYKITPAFISRIFFTNLYAHELFIRVFY